jgi:transposase InsO family protein
MHFQTSRSLSSFSVNQVEIPSDKPDPSFVQDIFQEIAKAKLRKQPPPQIPEVSDEIVQKVDKYLENLEWREGRLWKEKAIYIPVTKREEILFAAHKSPTSGHFSTEKTLLRLKGKVWWPEIESEVDQYCKGCSQCQRAKPRPTISGEIRPLEVSGCFERVHIDLVGPFPRTERGNEYALTAIDAATKYIVISAIPDKTANSVTEALIENLFLRYGFPQTIISDQGKEFVNRMNDRLCAKLGIHHRTTSAYHPASNGQIERQHRTLGNILRSLGSPDQSDWDILLQYAAFAINTATPRTTRQSPFFLMYGRHPRTVVDLIAELEPDPAIDLDEWWQRLTKAREVAAALEGKCRGVTKEPTQNLSPLSIGELVMVKFKATRRGKSTKLMPRQQGPYRVVAIRDGVTADLQSVKDQTDQITRHISHLVTYRGTEESQDDEWEIEEILDERIFRRSRQFLVSWKGFPEDSNSWVNEKDLSAPVLLEAWNQKKAKEKKVNDSRLIRSKVVKRKRYWLVAREQDHGPDDYEWHSEDAILNFPTLHLPSG